LFAENLPYSTTLTQLSLSQAAAFNQFISNNKPMNFKCGPKALETNQMTNKKHNALIKCKTALRQSVGWKIPGNTGGIASTIKIEAKSETLLNGFFPTFLLRKTHSEHKTFLENLIETNWHQAQYADFNRAVCRNENDEVSVMAPFWAEFFDVATNIVGEDSVKDPAIGCDMRRSDEDNSLMIYNTLCAATETSRSACDAHPIYLKYLKFTLASVCQEKHGQSVARSRLGSLKPQFDPLCQQRPLLTTKETTCNLKYGTLHGHRGESVPDLDSQQPSPIVQQGFWKKENYIFRGVVRQPESNTALQLLSSDIAGHCLNFKITEMGWLYLHQAALSDQCENNGKDIRTWLQNVEDYWAYDHDIAEKHLTLAPLETSETISWHCPLHWLQRFHDDKRGSKT
jgi:hypothetical protein